MLDTLRIAVSIATQATGSKLMWSSTYHDDTSVFTINEGLVNKERELAGLQLEEKNREAQLWRSKYLQLQVRPRSTIAA